MGFRASPAQIARLAAGHPDNAASLPLSEAAFQRIVLDLAKSTGWLIYHTRDSRRSQSGFPDLVLLKDRTIFAELKSEKGMPSDAQSMWLERLKSAGEEAYLWRPSDLPKIVEILRAE